MKGTVQWWVHLIVSRFYHVCKVMLSVLFSSEFLPEPGTTINHLKLMTIAIQEGPNV